MFINCKTVIAIYSACVENKHNQRFDTDLSYKNRTNSFY